MLDRALRMMDVDNANKCLTVYRGQGMDKNTFQKMRGNMDGLISFNGFLSTSKKHSTSLKFAKRAINNTELVGVLFVMNIDPQVSSTPFAFVGDVGYYGATEEEVLFSMHTVFRIGQVIPIGENNRLIQVQLSLANDKVNNLFDYIREKTLPDSNGRYQNLPKPKKVFETLLEEEPDEIEKAFIYRQLAVTKDQLGEYAEAIQYYEKSIDIEMKRLVPVITWDSFILT